MFGTSAALKVAVICVSRSMRSTTMITVGLPSFGCIRSFCAAKDHQQRFAAALEMPDQALLRITLHHSIDNLVGGEVLLVTADDLDAAVLVVGGEEGEVLQDIEHYSGRIMLATVALTWRSSPSFWFSSSRHGPQMSMGMRMEP
jgi:hypothetical protein